MISAEFKDLKSHRSAGFIGLDFSTSQLSQKKRPSVQNDGLSVFILQLILLFAF